MSNHPLMPWTERKEGREGRKEGKKERRDGRKKGKEEECI